MCGIAQTLSRRGSQAKIFIFKGRKLSLKLDTITVIKMHFLGLILYWFSVLGLQLPNVEWLYKIWKLCFIIIQFCFGLRASNAFGFAQFHSTFHKIKKLICGRFLRYWVSGSASYPGIDSRNPWLQLRGALNQ